MSDEKSELASIASSLRAYLEVQSDSGATGIPRGGHDRGLRAPSASQSDASGHDRGLRAPSASQGDASPRGASPAAQPAMGGFAPPVPPSSAPPLSLEPAT